MQRYKSSRLLLLIVVEARDYLASSDHSVINILIQKRNFYRTVYYKEKYKLNKMEVTGPIIEERESILLLT